MKHEYKIIVNSSCEMKNPFIYNYSRTKDIEIHIKKNKAMIRVLMSTKRTHEDLLAFKVGALKDAYRKVFLLHGLLFDQNINVKKVIMSIDGDSMEYDESTAEFPFVWSMISKKPMNLPESWKDRTFCQNLIDQPKSEANANLKYISVVAFLCSKGRPFVVDRFSNLWTSMNAYYNGLANVYNDRIRNEFYCTKDILKKLPEKVKTGMKLDYLQLVSSDAECIKFAIKCMDVNSGIIGNRKFDIPVNTDLRKCRYSFEQKLSRLSMEELSELYVYAQNRLFADPGLENDLMKNEKYNEINTLVENMGQNNLFFFLVFDYPYYCRCEYIHGGKALLLLAYTNEYEIKLLYAASYFVERFLLEKIPEWVRGDQIVPEDLIEERRKEMLAQNKADKVKNYKSAVEKYFNIKNKKTTL